MRRQREGGNKELQRLDETERNKTERRIGCDIK